MDPLLDAIVRSRRYDLLRQPSEVEAMGAGNVGGFQRLNDPLVDEQRFAAPSPREARANVRATVQDEMLAPAKTYGSKFLQWLAKAMIGSKGDIPPLDQTPEEFQESARNIASGFGPGILAGEKGALNIGGQVLKKFRTGEAVKDVFPSQELWRSYGYGRGAEGKGRFEISDVPAKLRPGAQEARTVGGALEHPELFKAYPQLASLPLRLRIDTLMSQGRFTPGGEVMAQGLGEKEALSNLLHELQHGVQHEEGFATGANLKGGREAYERSAGEQEAYNVQARLKSPDLMRFAPEGTETLPREMQLIKQDPQAVMDAVKEPGGMWHPEAVERLADALGGDRIERQYARNATVGMRGDREALGNNADQVIAFHAWTTKAIRNYLNRYAGTERDPLKEVEIPSGVHDAGVGPWGELFDASVNKGTVAEHLQGNETPGTESWSQQLQRAPRNEVVHELDDHTQSLQDIKGYLSHVGDYLRQNVSSEKLGQYDLVRAVKETAANDARVAKEMEKAAAASMKDLPVYKDYGDGFKWVELKKPEKLTEEQRKMVKDVPEKEWSKHAQENPDTTTPSYWALGPDGKPIRNTYTGELAGGESPEEAHLAGQLAQEGNQMGHCVGGYCEGVASGESRIFSLRDAKGRSHVTVEVGQELPGGRQLYQLLTEAEKKKIDPAMGVYVKQEGQARDDMLLEVILDEIPGIKERYKPDAQDIIQIKGKQNRAPSAEYLPYVQDFVKSGKWGEVGDLHNTGLLKTPDGYMTEAEWKARLAKRLEEMKPSGN